MKRHRAKQRRTDWLLAGIVAALALWHAPGAAAPGATNAAATADDPAARAAEAERAGRHEEAIAAYETLLARDRTFEPVVAPRLADLHIRLGQAAQALTWAARAASRQPDPAAYLAGVYARLGQFQDAAHALHESLRRAAEPERRIPLLWQLADVQISQGDVDAARNSLAQARDLAPPGARREAATERLNALRRRPATGAPEQADGSPGREATP